MTQTVPFKRVEKYLGGLIQAEQQLEYKAGQTIFYEGHQPYGIYIVRKGRVRFFHGPEGREEKLIQVVGPGHMFCEEPFLKNTPYGFSAKAETDVSLSFFSRLVFDLGGGGKE